MKPNTIGWICGPSYFQPSKEFGYIYKDLVVSLGFKPTKELNTQYTSPGPQILKFHWGSEVYTKSEENPDSLLGEELDWLILSEGSRMKEPTYDTYLRARLGSRQGRVIIPTTPHGYNWLYKRFYLPAVEGDSQYWSRIVSVLENQNFSKEEYERAKKELPEDVFREQYDGEFVAYSGLIYKRFSRQLHCIEPFKIPGHWIRYMIADPHPSTPAAILWIAVDEYDTLYLYDEMFIPDLTIPEICARITAKEGKGVVIYKRLIDPNAKYIDKLRGQTSSVKMQFAREGINCTEANNKFESAYYKIEELLTPKPVYGSDIKKPHLFVFKNCKEAIHEFESCSWENEKENHMLDCLKYCVNDNPVRTWKTEEVEEIRREEQEELRAINPRTGY
jgi:Terminase large subunit, T4likevirus-type, N-terminal